MSDPHHALTSWLTDMPKAELHLHLDGSLRPATALELAQSRPHGIGDVPTDLAGMRQRLVAPARCLDQAELLRAFDLPIALLQDAEALERCARELVQDVAAEGTVYAEIRWAPSLHLERGLSLRAAIAAVVHGTGLAASAAGIDIRVIAVALRTHSPEMASAMARVALEFLDTGLTGFDIAGVERDAPDLRIFDEAISIARHGGLGITCHAGEWGGPTQVWRALQIDPERIAHGAVAVDDPALMAVLSQRGVTLDICPSSNLQAGIGSRGPDAPLPRLLRAGVPVTISTDDRTVGDLTLVRELSAAVADLGLAPAEVAGTMRQAFAAAFLQHDEALRARLAARFEAWLEDAPVPC